MLKLKQHLNVNIAYLQLKMLHTNLLYCKDISITGLLPFYRYILDPLDHIVKKTQGFVHILVNLPLGQCVNPSPEFYGVLCNRGGLQRLDPEANSSL